jgi:hypothetical protein
MRKSAIILLAAAVLFGVAGVALAASTVTVEGELTSGGAAGSDIDVDCAIVGGSLTGHGTLYGTYQNGVRYTYPFTITRGSTGRGVLYLYGAVPNGPQVRIQAAVPSGQLVFSYQLANGTVINSYGQGTVVAQ